MNSEVGNWSLSIWHCYLSLFLPYILRRTRRSISVGWSRSFVCFSPRVTDALKSTKRKIHKSLCERSLSWSWFRALKLRVCWWSTDRNRMRQSVSAGTLCILFNCLKAWEVTQVRRNVRQPNQLGSVTGVLVYAYEASCARNNSYAHGSRRPTAVVVVGASNWMFMFCILPIAVRLLRVFLKHWPGNRE